MIEWEKVQNTEISERNSIPNIGNINEKQSTISEINIFVKNIIHEREPDVTSLNHPIYAFAVISIKLCNVKIKALKRNVPKKRAWQEHIQKQIDTLRSNLKTLKNAQNGNQIKVSKSKKLRLIMK